MKRVLCLLFSLILVIGMMPGIVMADGGDPTALEKEGWTYVIAENGDITITGYLGEEGDITVPAMIDSKPVTAIGDGAFAGNPILVNVKVQEGVRVIGAEAFCDCPNLKKVILPESVEELGSRTFRYCYSLEDITLPAQLTDLPYQGCWECQSLTKIAIPDSVTAIPNGCFYNCFSLIDVTVPEGLVTIEKNAFHACTHLETIVLSDNVTQIDETAFSDCGFLAITAPENSVADQYAKEHGLVPENVVLESLHPYTESDIWEYTYPDETAAIQVTFSPKTFVRGQFEMDSITITDEEGREYVYILDQLAGETLVLPGNSFTLELTTIFARDDFGFRITDVEPMSMEAYEAYLGELNDNPWEAHIVNGTLEITGYKGLMENVTVPSEINGISVAAIADSAFTNNMILKNVVIGDGILTIGVSAFEGCENLESVTIPDSVSEIQANTFFGCTSLRYVVLPDGLEKTDQYAFSICRSLTELSLPDTLTEIGEGAFSGSGLCSLVIPDGVTVIPASMCQQCSALETVILPDSITEIGDRAFDFCGSLSEILLPEQLAVIGKSAFSATAALKSLKLPDSLKTIGDYAFSVSSLTSLHIPDGVAETGINPVLGCSSLMGLTVDPDNPYLCSKGNIVYNKVDDTLLFCAGGLSGEVTVPDGVKIIATSAFSGMKSLTSVIIPESVIEMSYDVFDSCTALETVTIAAGIQELPESTFLNCSSLKKVFLPDSLESIGRMAFYNCQSLGTIAMPRGMNSIARGAFSGCEQVVFLSPVDIYAFEWAGNNGILAVEPPVGLDQLFCNDEEQELIIPGTASAGVLWYALGKDGVTPPDATEYSEEIPTASEPGTYYVWYRVFSDEYPNNTTADYVVSGINMKNYNVIEGANATVQEGAGRGITFRVDGDLSKFTGIRIDNNNVAAGMYTVWSGSTYVRLKEELIDSLSVGEHKIEFLFTDGSCETTLVVEGTNPTPYIPTPKTHTVTFRVVNGSWNDGTNGDVKVETGKLTANDIPAVGNKPNEGYEAGSWDVIPSTTTIITKDTTYTYSYKEKSEIWPFTDVKEEPGNWIYDAAKYVYDRGIMTGMTPTYFGAAETLSRGQFATILYRIANPTGVTYKQIFPDVKESDWFGIPVAWCNATGVVTGYMNGLFGPGDDITREQLATMLYRYAEYAGYDVSEKVDLSKYPDAKDVSSWAKEAMEWAVGSGVVQGKDGGTYLDPQGNASRAECATMVMRFVEKYVG